jgi:hypothetical protein
MSLLRLVLVFGFVLGTSAYADPGSLRRIGIDNDGNAIDEPVDAASYSEEFQAIVGSVSESALPVLNRSTTAKRWQLQTIVVGVGLGMEFGVGPLIKIKATPRLRVLFSRTDDPIVP